MDSSISIERIAEAARVIDRVFLRSPQFVCEPLGKNIVLKVETANPIRSFKGRGTDYLLHVLTSPRSGEVSLLSSPRSGEVSPKATEGSEGLVCASAGNFGQGMALACRKRGVPLTVFASEAANALKIDRMRALGATVVLVPGDFDAAKDAARNHGGFFIEDGLLGPIAEGAGTIGVELASETLEAVLVPLGNGSLVNGIGTWLKHHSPDTRIIAVCAEGAPSMALSWKAHEAVTAPSDTIADGIAVRVPIPDAVRIMETTVDDVVLVTDREMLDAMRALFYDAGLLVEPAGAAGVAAIKKLKPEGRVAAILTGGNLTEQQVRDWLY